MTDRDDHDHAHGPDCDHDHAGPEASAGEMDLSRYEGISGPVVRELSPTDRELLAVVPGERFAGLVLAETQALARQVTLKGFRAGKAPLARVGKLYQDDIRRRAIQKLLDEVWQEARSAHGLRPIADPVLTEIAITAGEPVRFAARFEILPEVKLKGLDEIRPTDKVVDVTEKDVDGAIDELRQIRGEMVPSQKTEVGPGDLAVLDLERWDPEADRKESPSAEKRTAVVVHVGQEGNMPGLDRALLGMVVGETRDFTTKNPPTHRVPELAGAEIPCRVTVQGIRERKLPEVDDAFAQAVAGVASVELLRAEVREGLRGQRRERARREQEAEAVEQLIAKNPVEIPRSLVEQEAEARLKRGLEEMVRRGVDVQSMTIDWKSEFERMRQVAERDLRADWLLELAAREKNVEITDADVESEVQDVARQRRLSEDVARAQLRQGNRMSAFRASIRRRRILDVLRSGATISEK